MSPPLQRVHETYQYGHIKSYTYIPSLQKGAYIEIIKKDTLTIHFFLLFFQDTYCMQYESFINFKFNVHVCLCFQKNSISQIFFFFLTKVFATG